MIKRGQSSSIDVEVGVNLDRGNLETHSLEQETSGGGNDTLANTRDDTTRDDNVFLDHDDKYERLETETETEDSDRDRDRAGWKERELWNKK